MSPPPKLFAPLCLGNGRIQLEHRVIMAPMTRNRGVSLAAGTPEQPNRTWLADEVVANYYGQRASRGGLLITEGIPPSIEVKEPNTLLKSPVQSECGPNQAVSTNLSTPKQASGMPNVPGIFDDSQKPGWKRVVDTVHTKGGFIYAQLWHAGRATIPQLTGTLPVSSSAIPWDTDEKYPFRTPFTKEKVAYRDHPPIEMTPEHMRKTIDDFVRAAKTALEVGFDGVEINGGNGNLLDQFLHSNINQRSDEYGGSPENRCRFPLELLAAVAAAVGPNNVAIRMEPTGLYQHTRGNERVETWSLLCEKIRDTYAGERKLSYVHFIEPRFDRIDSEVEKESFYNSWSLPTVSNAHFRMILAGTPCISAGGWGPENCNMAAESGQWDALAFARWFTSNPDLPERLKLGYPLAAPDRSRFYGSWDGARESGYTNYPTWQEECTLKKGEVDGVSGADKVEGEKAQH